MPRKTILFLSLPLAALVTIVSCVSLLTPGFYTAETLNWQAQSTGQDMVNLFLLTPCLVVSAVLSYRNNAAATAIWGGTVFYLAYTFTLYCFNVHFNQLFFLYCVCLSLSFYSCVYFFVAQHKTPGLPRYTNSPAIRFTGTYFIIIALLFYLLWLGEIIPSTIHHTVPKSVIDAGLFTNGVQVLDLAIVLPAIFISGVLLLKQTSFGFVVAPVLLTFFVLMDITIGALVVVMKIKGVESELSITFIMGILALVSLLLLVWHFKCAKPVAST